MAEIRVDSNAILTPTFSREMLNQPIIRRALAFGSKILAGANRRVLVSRAVNIRVDIQLPFPVSLLLFTTSGSGLFINPSCHVCII